MPDFPDLAALMAAEVAAEVEKQSGKPVMIEAATLPRALETHVRAQLDGLADLRFTSGWKSTVKRAIFVYRPTETRGNSGTAIVPSPMGAACKHDGQVAHCRVSAQARCAPFAFGGMRPIPQRG